MNERRIHQVFVISVLLKGVDALIECASGVVLFFISTGTIVGWVNFLTQEELIEDPRDFIATHLLTMAQHLSVGAKTFYAAYLLSHGLIKALLVWGLLKEKLLAYPLSLAAIGGFIVYQLYRYSYTHSLGLIVLTVFDLFVMVLIWHEWHILKQRRAA